MIKYNRKVTKKINGVPTEKEFDLHIEGELIYIVATIIILGILTIFWGV